MPLSTLAAPGPAAAGPAFELSWELFGELCRVLALRVAQDYRPEVVVGLSTAGVLPAATVAMILDAELHTLRISRRERGAVVRATPQVLSPTPVAARGKRVLIVDEITTSGDTLRLALAAVREVGPAEVRTAASFVRPGGYRPDYHALETESLVVFPWDRQVVDRGRGFVPPPLYAGAVTPG